MAQSYPLIILGGSSFIAPYLFRRVQAAGLTAQVISRKTVDVPEGLSLEQMDLARARNWVAPDGAVVISLIPLWVLAEHLPRFMGIKSLIALGSTSVFAKSNSIDASERQLAATLAAAETAIRQWCLRSHVPYTLLRTTLIYDGEHDHNVARIARFIRRFRFFPLAAPAKGLRQPIHADDVAAALMAALNNPEAANKEFNIAGAEKLTYRAMAERIFQNRGVRPRFLSLPPSIIGCAARWGGQLGLTREGALEAKFMRMNEDLVFDTSPGLAALRLNPREFMKNE